jgi:hypothetical protein
MMGSDPLLVLLTGVLNKPRLDDERQEAQITSGQKRLQNMGRRIGREILKPSVCAQAPPFNK